MTAKVSTLDRICFVVSPIGQEGTELHQTFRDVLDYVIRPAVEHLGLGFKVIRADDIERAGSFIKDILEYIAGAHVVIADLTGQNPNVFYELGVRHALSARTILIAQQGDDIPSDLREYRTIIYDTSARGAVASRQRIARFLREIEEDAQRLDNPVLDRLGNVTLRRALELEAEVAQLRAQLDAVRRSRSGGQQLPEDDDRPRDVASVRVERVFLLRRIRQRRIGDNQFLVPHPEARGTIQFSLPAGRGDLALYASESADRNESAGRIEFYYVAVASLAPDIDRLLADMRVLMEDISELPVQLVKFIVVSDAGFPREHPRFRRLSRE